MISHYPPKLRAHRHCGSGYVKYFVSHVISKDYKTQELCGFIDKSPS